MFLRIKQPSLGAGVQIQSAYIQERSRTADGEKNFPTAWMSINENTALPWISTTSGGTDPTG